MSARLDKTPAGDDTYEQDFHAWAMHQAALLRAGRLTELDAENVAEEIEALARSEKRELSSRLAVLLLHLLKWSHQTERRGNSWRFTIEEQRELLAEHLAENPSLRARLDTAIHGAYGAALRRAERETNLPRDHFPSSCPYTAAQVLDEAFWPDPA